MKEREEEEEEEDKQEEDEEAEEEEEEEGEEEGEGEEGLSGHHAPQKDSQNRLILNSNMHRLGAY